MAEPVRIRKVVIVGRDESLWLSAHVLWRAFRNAGLEVVAVELPSLLRRGDAYSTLKTMEVFHGLMGFEEAPLMRASQATFSLGQRFVNWSKVRPSFMNGYSTYGKDINRIRFHHYWVKAQAAGMKAAFEDFSINAAAAKQGRFFVPGAETDGFATSDYGYNLEAIGYCNVLRNAALKRGISHFAGRLGQVVKDAADGHITAVKLANGETIEGDFFIDATGAESALLGKALDVGFESWKQWFPCDRLLTTYAPQMSPLPSFSQVSAFRSGWVGIYPLRDSTSVQQVYSSRDLKDEEAFETAGMVSSMSLHPQAVVTPFEVGVRGALWHKNCVAIGEAAAVLDPLDCARMQANLIGLSHLVSLFPTDRNCLLESQEYNRNVALSLERIRDFQICHYLLNQRFDQPLWDRCRAMDPPASLAYKLQLFAARGSLVTYDDETFTEDEWTAMLIGHGLIPKAYDPIVDQTEDGEVIQHFQKMLGFIRMNVEKMRPMEDFLGMPA
jgi:tryptophan halogenase